MRREKIFKEGSLYIYEDAREAVRALAADPDRAVCLYIEDKNAVFDSLPFEIKYILYGEEALEDEEYLHMILLRQLGIPVVIGESDRIIVRESVAADAEKFVRIYNEPGVCEYIDNISTNVEEETEKITAYIDNMYPLYGMGLWTVELNDISNGLDDSYKCKTIDALDIDKNAAKSNSTAPCSHIVIGRAGLTYIDDSTAELGYVIGKEWQHKGYGFEACCLILGYAEKKLDISRIKIRIKEGNKASFILADKLKKMAMAERMNIAIEIEAL